MKKKVKIFACDFETTVYEGQESTEVWSSACVELYTNDVYVFHSIEEQYEFFENMDENIIAYYHNLKFDGTFWIDYLIQTRQFVQAISNEDFVKDADMPKESIKYLISDMGLWYSFTIKTKKGKTIEMRDSLKLMPFSLKEIGNAFETVHKKLDMEYLGYRYAGCDISDNEMEYIKNDVLVLKEALEKMFDEGHNKLTIGSCCMSEFRSCFNFKEYQNLFPNLYEIEIPCDKYQNAGEYIQRSYHGGWCYVVPEKTSKRYYNGLTLDVNSLYPSMMHSMSGNKYPFGYPTFWKGNYIPKEAEMPNRYYFIRFKTRFYIKKDYLPTIQIKSSPFYKSTEWLTTSDIKNFKDGQYYKQYRDKNGTIHDAFVEMIMTEVDFKLMKEHYNLVDFEIIDGIYFYCSDKFFDSYIDKYMKIKQESKGAKRTQAKLFLNNLYGKMATNTNSSFKYAFVDNEDNVIRYKTIYQHNKKPGYIAIGSAITSYSRNFTIRAAQANYHGPDKPGFIYADTDSIHVNIPMEEVKDVKLDDKEFCCWKIENKWDIGWFVRQKTYIEYNKDEGYDIKCAGMPKHCKNLLIDSFNGTTNEARNEKEMDFVKVKRNFEDFDRGLIVPGKLLPKRIKGGTILEETTFEML